MMSGTPPPVTGTFVATGLSPSFTPMVSALVSNPGMFNISIWGTFVGTVRLERSMDGGAFYHPMTVQTSSGVVYLYQFTAPGSEDAQSGIDGAKFQLNCTSYTSGTINYALRQW